MVSDVSLTTRLYLLRNFSQKSSACADQPRLCLIALSAGTASGARAPARGRLTTRRKPQRTYSASDSLTQRYKGRSCVTPIRTGPWKRPSHSWRPRKKGGDRWPACPPQRERKRSEADTRSYRDQYNRTAPPKVSHAYIVGGRGMAEVPQ